MIPGKSKIWIGAPWTSIVPGTLRDLVHQLPAVSLVSMWKPHVVRVVNS